MVFRAAGQKRRRYAEVSPMYRLPARGLTRRTWRFWKLAFHACVLLEADMHVDGASAVMADWGRWSAAASLVGFCNDKTAARM